jgi:hypothetical protein
MKQGQWTGAGRKNPDIEFSFPVTAIWKTIRPVDETLNTWARDVTFNETTNL